MLNKKIFILLLSVLSSLCPNSFGSISSLLEAKQHALQALDDPRVYQEVLCQPGTSAEILFIFIAIAGATAPRQNNNVRAGRTMDSAKLTANALSKNESQYSYPHTMKHLLSYTDTFLKEENLTITNHHSTGWHSSHNNLGTSILALKHFENLLQHKDEILAISITEDNFLKDSKTAEDLLTNAHVFPHTAIAEISSFMEQARNLFITITEKQNSAIQAKDIAGHAQDIINHAQHTILAYITSHKAAIISSLGSAKAFQGGKRILTLAGIVGTPWLLAWLHDTRKMGKDKSSEKFIVENIIPATACATAIGYIFTQMLTKHEQKAGWKYLASKLDEKDLAQLHTNFERKLAASYQDFADKQAKAFWTKPYYIIRSLFPQFRQTKKQIKELDYVLKHYEKLQTQ